MKLHCSLFQNQKLLKRKRMEKKSILNWLRRIEDEDVRTRAIHNYKIACKKNPAKAAERVSYLSVAIMNAFNWGSTPEGGTYWVRIHDEVSRKAYTNRRV
jgi:hypothetical protein